jgi:hypothetical protein
VGKGSLGVPSGVLQWWKVVILEDSQVPILRRNLTFVPKRAYGHIPIIPFLGTYPRTFKKTDMRGAWLTSRRDCSHIIGRDFERMLIFNATVSPVDLNISIVSQNRYCLKGAV